MVQDTPSIIHADISTVRPGRILKYSELTSREKRDYLFEQGIRPTAYDNGKRPDVMCGLLQFSKSALESIANHLLSATLTRVSDEFEEPKLKLFHAYGTTAKIQFSPEPNTPYTGIFAETAYGLARFSYAGPVAGIGVVPGLGLKFPVDGDHPSENLVVMRKLDRQQPLWRFFSTHSHNSVFQNAFTNILPSPRFTNLIMRTVQSRFETVVNTGKGLHQPADNLAAIHTNGVPLAADKVAAPYRLIFRPTAQAVASSDPSIDFRDDLAQNVKAGTPIYEIFALTEAQESELHRRGVTEVEDLLPHAQKIGTMTTESEFIASQYGDYRLFLKHNARFIREGFRGSTT
jgi:hypothetical protein